MMKIGYTDHALLRLRQRNVTRSQVERVLRNGNPKHNQDALVFRIPGKNLSVVIDGDTVVTVYFEGNRSRKRKRIRQKKSWPGARHTL